MDRLTSRDGEFSSSGLGPDYLDWLLHRWVCTHECVHSCISAVCLPIGMRIPVLMCVRETKRLCEYVWMNV